MKILTKKLLLLLAGLLLIGQIGLVLCGKALAQPVWQPDVYDVIVIGGEPEGVAAAVSAARNGLRTLLVEDDEALGGLMTLGMLNVIDMCRGQDGTLLTQGIFKEFYEAVGGESFDVERAKTVFMKLVQSESNIELKMQTKFVAPVMEGNSLIGVTLLVNGQEKSYRASRVIDATVDADVAAAAGVPYTFGREDIGEKDRQMCVTLVFSLQGVDWPKVRNYLKKDGNSASGISSKSAWGYGNEANSYQPHDATTLLRGLNIGIQDNGNVLVNALLIFDVDVLDEDSKAAAIARGKAELAYIVPYLRQNFTGFANCSLAGVASQLYVRESRHIIGEYQLTVDDVLENRDQWDKIAIGSYPVDVHSYTVSLKGVVLGNPDRYAVPFRCLVPQVVDNLLVVGRSASYTSLAAGSARVIPVGMAEGQAAGVASAYSIRHSISFRAMTTNKEAIHSVQQQLKNQGAYLEDFNISTPVMSHWAYPGLKVLRALGVTAAGYNNDYQLSATITKSRFENMFNTAMQKAGALLENVRVSEQPTNAEIIAEVTKMAVGEAGDYAASLAQLQKMGIINSKMAPFFADPAKRPQAAEVIMLVANLYRYEENQHKGDKDIKVYLDGQLLELEQTPYLQNGAVLLPMRAILEQLEATVKYDSATKKITVLKGQDTILLTVGQKTAYINATPFELSLAPCTREGVTLVPLRFLAEALQASVDWDGSSKTITIQT